MLRASSLGTVTLQAERSLAWLDGKYGFERFEQFYLFFLRMTIFATDISFVATKY